MIKICHICPDEKFIDIAINIFLQLHNVSSEFCTVLNYNPPKQIKAKVNNFKSTGDLVDYINNSGFDYVVMHSLYCMEHKYKLLKIKPEIIGISWGYDIYSDRNDIIKMALDMDLFMPLTRKYTKNRDGLKCGITRILRKIYCKLLRKQWQYDSLLNKVSYLSTVLPDEFPEIQKRFPHLKYIPFDYMDPNARIPFRENTETNQNILVGHCLLPTNNHFDILDLMERRKITCNAYIPIAYPNGNYEQFDSEYYKKKLKEFCSGLKYVKPIFLEGFIDKYEYFKIIDRCSCAIFGQFRQEAIGNINHMLYTGKKIFLWSDGMNWRYYSKHAKVFSITDDLYNSVFDSVLESKIQKRNWKFIYEKEKYFDYIKQLNFIINFN